MKSVRVAQATHTVFFWRPIPTHHKLNMIDRKYGRGHITCAARAARWIDTIFCGVVPSTVLLSVLVQEPFPKPGHHGRQHSD